MATIREIVNQTRAYDCLECGKCTSVCPVAESDGRFSPRQVVRRVLAKEDEALADPGIWACLTCRLCEERCPSDVRYVEFIREVRTRARTRGWEGTCSHGGALRAVQRLLANPELHPRRSEPLVTDRAPPADSQWLYFVGCLPYFDEVMADFKPETERTADSTRKVLRHLGIAPALLPDERCCGHDLLWTGDLENFQKLARLNQERIKKTGVKRLVTSCAECYWTLKYEYPRQGFDLGLEVLHVSELLADAARTGRLPPARGKRRVTYQDPCRLGRHSGCYEAPRVVLQAVADLAEMKRNRKDAVCCGTSCFTNCSSFSKQIQTSRLRAARTTGADVLVTSCPKCQLHFLCAQTGDFTRPEERIPVVDLATVVAEALTL